MLRFYFFAAKQGTSVHEYDRGPSYILCCIHFKMNVLWKQAKFLQAPLHCYERSALIFAMLEI